MTKQKVYYPERSLLARIALGLVLFVAAVLLTVMFLAVCGLLRLGLAMAETSAVQTAVVFVAILVFLVVQVRKEKP